MGFRLALLPLTLHGLEPSYFKVIKITRQIFENGDRYDDGVSGTQIGNLETDLIQGHYSYSQIFR